MSISSVEVSSVEVTHVREMMRRTRNFWDAIEAEGADKEHLAMIRMAAMGGAGDSGEDEVGV